MKSSPKVPRPSDNLTLALEAKYRGLVTGSPQRLVLWLPLHRTPSPNKLMGRFKVTLREKVEAKHALLSARVSTSHCSASDSSTRITNTRP